MEEQKLRSAAIQESLGLSNQDALKVLAFISGLQAGEALRSSEEVKHKPQTAAV